LFDGIDENMTSQNLIKAFLKFRRMGISNGKAFTTPEIKMPNGLRHSEIMILFAIKEVENNYPDGISVSDLSSYLNVKPPTITPMLSSLEEKNMLERVMDADDRRIMRVSLKDAGSKFADECAQHIVSHIQGLVDYLGAEKSNSLADLMNEVYEYFSQIPKHEKGDC